MATASMGNTENRDSDRKTPPENKPTETRRSSFDFHLQEQPFGEFRVWLTISLV